MKKFRIIALVLCIVMMLSAVAGCSLISKATEDPDQKAIVGTWTSDPLDFSDALNKEVAEGVGEEYAEYFTFEGFAFNLVFTFNEDGTYTMEADQASIETLTESIKAQFAENVEKFYTALAEQYGITMDDVLEATGYESLDAAVEEMTSEFDFTEMATEMNASGKYLVKDGQLYLLDAENENTYTDLFNYTLSGDTLTLDEAESDSDAGDYAIPYPIVLHR